MLYGLVYQVCGGVVQDFQCFWVFVGDDLQVGVVVDGEVGIYQFVVDFVGQGGFGQIGVDGGGYVLYGYGMFEWLFVVVGKGDFDYGKFLLKSRKGCVVFFVED